MEAAAAKTVEAIVLYCTCITGAGNFEIFALALI